MGGVSFDAVWDVAWAWDLTRFCGRTCGLREEGGWRKEAQEEGWRRRGRRRHRCAAADSVSASPGRPGDLSSLQSPRTVFSPLRCSERDQEERPRERTGGETREAEEGGSWEGGQGRGEEESADSQEEVMRAGKETSPAAVGQHTAVGHSPAAAPDRCEMASSSTRSVDDAASKRRAYISLAQQQPKYHIRTRWRDELVGQVVAGGGCCCCLAGVPPVRPPAAATGDKNDYSDQASSTLLIACNFLSAVARSRRHQLFFHHFLFSLLLCTRTVPQRGAASGFRATCCGDRWCLALLPWRRLFFQHYNSLFTDWREGASPASRPLRAQ